MDKGLVVQFVISTLLRYWLCHSEFKSLFQDRVEISNPINAWKNLVEGVTLMKDQVNPYDGDIFHESPLILHMFKFIIGNDNPYVQQSIPLIFILCDLLSAILLYYMAQSYMIQMVQIEKQNKHKYAKNITRILINIEDLVNVPKYVALAYLYNPFSILNCICLTSTVFANLFLCLFFFAFVTQKPILSSIALTLTVQQNIYPITLLVPACVHFHQYKKSWRLFLAGFLLCYSGFLYFCLVLMNQDTSFLAATYGFQLTVPNLQPNIGLFWYFFTEMFEHFRVLFIVAFQINSIFLYVLPLTLRLYKEPVLVAICLTGLAAVFKSYPCVGDIALYLALMPLCKYLFPFMQQGFIVACFFIGCSMFAPTVWHLWIYTRSANANFYFGVTLAFATSQIFLLTDLLFAYLKRDYTLENGIQKTIKGKPARLVLD
ncbi:hypothetical protein M8J77_013206 [Diaphorina citri]|nr:hypothetical protein M8J77_013206 [Diaphorina citri]